MNQHDPTGRSILDLLREIVEKSSERDYIYRGEPECFPKISSTLYRLYEKDIDTEHFDIEIAQKEMLEQVKEFTAFTDDIDILTELQHYGGKTNLIDFTTDYLIALFFACDSSYGKDGRVILLDKTSRQHQIKSPKKNQINRVISQKSIFVRTPTGCLRDNEVETVSIPKELKQVVMQYLQKYHGITTETIYSDILGYIQNQEKHQTAYAEFYIGYTYAENGEYEKAISHYDKTIHLNPNVTSAYRNRGSAKTQLGKHEEAIADYNVLIGFFPRDADAYYNRGLSNLGSCRQDEAIADFSEAIRINPDHFAAYNSRGAAKANLELYKDAIADFDEAIRINLEDATLYINRGQAKANCNKHHGAITDYDKAIRLNPEYAKAYLDRGVSKFTLNSYEEAMADFDEAIRIDKDYTEAYYWRGIVAKILKRNKEAKRDLEQARTLAQERKNEDLLELSQQALDELGP